MLSKVTVTDGKTLFPYNFNSDWDLLHIMISSRFLKLTEFCTADCNFHSVLFKNKKMVANFEKLL